MTGTSCLVVAIAPDGYSLCSWFFCFAEIGQPQSYSAPAERHSQREYPPGASATTRHEVPVTAGTSQERQRLPVTKYQSPQVPARSVSDYPSRSTRHHRYPSGAKRLPVTKYQSPQVPVRSEATR